MKRWKHGIKVGVTLLLVLVLGLQTFQGFEISEVQATTVNADLSTEGKVANGDFESGRVGYRVKGWSLIGMNSDGSKHDDPDKWTSNFTLKTDSDGGSKVATLAKTGTGYAAMTSEHVVIEEQKTYQLSIDYKVKDYSVDIDPTTGQPYTTNADYYGIRFIVEQYDANGNALSYNKYPSTAIKERPEEWTNHNTTFTTNKNAKSVVVYCWLGGGMRLNVTTLFDNVTISASGTESVGWTMERSGPNGIPRTDNTDYTRFYEMSKIDGGIGHKNALKLRVTRADGMFGGVVIYSDPISVQGAEEYTTSYNLKVENYIAAEDTNNNKIYGAVTVLRYKDSQGNYINEDSPEICSGQRDNTDWKYFEYTFTAPEDAVSAQFGLVMGSNLRNICKNMAYSIDNIVILEKEAHEDYKKDPAVTGSALYKQSALFVGDSIGSGLAEQATSYSEMRVTNVCSDTVSVNEQLRSHAGGAYDYLIISGGMKENEANMPTGNVTADTIYMDGMNFDTTTYAGILESTFGRVAEYYNQQKVVYVLTTNNVAYRKVAQQAAEKWNVQLVMLNDVSDAVVNWNETIEPAETAEVFDCYDVPKFLDYLKERVDILVGTEISVTSDIATLEVMKEKATLCKDTHPDYEGYQALVEKIDGVIVQCEEFRPLMCGATIAVDNPNVLSFIASSPKKVLTEGVTVKAMGILSLPVTYLDVDAEEYKADAVLELNNAYVKNMEATYTEASKEYRVYQEAWEADPYTEYVATAYVVYEANGEDYVFYSSNDYVNAVGIRTATGGRCIKSVFGISKRVAIQLATAKGNAMDFAAISGEDNVPLIQMATEDSEITLLDVYRLVGDNKVILEEWVGEGGATK